MSTKQSHFHFIHDLSLTFVLFCLTDQVICTQHMHDCSFRLEKLQCMTRVKIRDILPGATGKSSPWFTMIRQCHVMEIWTQKISEPGATLDEPGATFILVISDRLAVVLKMYNAIYSVCVTVYMCAMPTTHSSYK